ncbi:MAG TPA: peptidoglycan-binding domain-containing protein [Bryobacteraceae bacterium]|nr:peptidoglycan-binding domain-containing protein [Bryobacteraceae bacterium]
MEKNLVSMGRSLLRAAVFTGIGVFTAFARTPGDAGQPNARATSYERQNVLAPSRRDVRAAQRRLRRQGLYHGKIDGILGPQTREALLRYQRRNRLYADGRLTRQTAEHMGIARPGVYFETARWEYGNVGRNVAGGATGMVSQFGHGKVVPGFTDLGKGVWGGVKSVGSATANGAKGVYHGVGRAVTGRERRPVGS